MLFHGTHVGTSPPIANCRPMLPKQTQAQKRTLATQVRTAMPSCVTPTANASFSAALFRPNVADELPVDVGINSGFRPRRSPIPANPTAIERRNPDRVRSIRYHRTGLARARATEACVVDSHGSRR